MKRFCLTCALIFPVGLIGCTTTEQPAKTYVHTTFGDIEQTSSSQSKTTDTKEASSPSAQTSDTKVPNSQPDTQNATDQSSQASSPKISGDNATISGLAATSQESYDLMGKVIARNNQDAVKQMVVNGEILMLPEGTKVLLVDRGLITTEAKITEGPYAGAEVWVPSEVVK
ncbi:hypothetical protein PP175_21580 [Aneurinibacillus sp. Ricciae_BoGa-3]|uniref:hypothetical protein n=1 Tax=Aneurinibacillus sp. Ricciae_BoGa-3 TaxID=3022697 RepID=UPI00233FD5A0|nr:hypothetical protein [Aneurinibacillus sp. Ricciae_BoGa-3]WCK53883.1 hypothetical protein PP175_21580 [Aneurinibacillus sp. Ricciae_BoGa-3]